MRILTLCLLAGAMALPAAAVAADAPKAAYKAPRANDGHASLEGNWTNASLTRLERDPQYGDKLTISSEEASKVEKGEADFRNLRNQPTKEGTKVDELPCSKGFTGTNCGYNAGWTDPGSTIMRVGGQPRTSFITSTANGRIPPLKPEAAARARPVRREGVVQGADAGAGAGIAIGGVNNPEDRSLGERCIMSFGNSSGPVMQPQLYNNNYQFTQTKDELAIWVEMVHDVRHIRIGATQHLASNVRPWMGDSIAHWEGETLVAETTNFPAAQSFRGSDENLKVTERFTRVAPDRLLYQFKVEDPTVWTQPWGGEYEFAQLQGQVYEYACHEGNYALEGILAGARADEAAKAMKSAAAAPAK